MSSTNVRGGQVLDQSIVLTPGVGQDITGVLPVANGGTNVATLPLNQLVVGNGTGSVLAIAPGASGNHLTSDGTVWSSTNNDIPLSKKSPSVNQVITAGFSAYLANEYEIQLGKETEIGLGATLEIG